MKTEHLILFTFLVILLSSLTTATITVDTNLPDSIPQNYTLEISLSNSTQFITTGATCTTGLYLPNGTSEYSNTSAILTQNLQNLPVGIHKLQLTCNSDVEIGSTSQTLKVTRTGEITSNIIEGLTWLLFIIAIIGNIIFLILILVKLVTIKETIFGVLEAWGLYLLLIIVNYMGGFMTSDYIASRTDFFITILTWSNGVLPAISLAVSMMIRSLQKTKPLNVKEIIGRTPLSSYGQ